MAPASSSLPCAGTSVAAPPACASTCAPCCATGSSTKLAHRALERAGKRLVVLAELRVAPVRPSGWAATYSCHSSISVTPLRLSSRWMRPQSGTTMGAQARVGARLHHQASRQQARVPIPAAASSRGTRTVRRDRSDGCGRDLTSRLAFGISAIGECQRFLLPYKSFSCAHRRRCARRSPKRGIRLLGHMCTLSVRHSEFLVCLPAESCCATCVRPAGIRAV